MTWNINISGHDDLSGEEKEELENGLVEKTRSFVADLAGDEGNIVTNASVSTNTTGSVDVKASSGGAQ